MVAGGDGRLRHATLIADHHLIRLANACVDQVRRRVQQNLTGHRGRTHDPLYRVRRLLVDGAGRQAPRGLSGLSISVRTTVRHAGPGTGP